MATQSPNYDLLEEPAAAAAPAASNVGIFWDLENCPLPSSQTFGSFTAFLRQKFIRNPSASRSHEVQFTIICDVYKHEHKLQKNIEQTCNVRLRHLDSSIPEAANYKLLEEIRNFMHIYRSSNPGLVLLCGNIDFSDELLYYKVRMGCSITLVFGASSSDQIRLQWSQSEILDLNSLYQDIEKFGQISLYEEIPHKLNSINGNLTQEQQIDKIIENEKNCLRRAEIRNAKCGSKKRYFVAVFGFESNTTSTEINEHIRAILDQALSIPGIVEGIKNQQAWISFPDVASAEVALEGINKMQICGKLLRAHFAPRLPKRVPTLQCDLDCNWRKTDTCNLKSGHTQATEFISPSSPTQPRSESCEEVIAQLLEQSRIHQTIMENGSQTIPKYYLHIHGISKKQKQEVSAFLSTILSAHFECFKSGGAWFSFEDVNDAIRAARRISAKTFKKGKKLIVECVENLPNASPKIVTIKVSKIPESVEIDEIRVVFQNFLQEKSIRGNVHRVEIGQTLLRFPFNRVAESAVAYLKYNKFFGQLLKIEYVKTTTWT